MSEERDPLDDELDAALAIYSRQRERVGLQARILGQLDQARKLSRSVWYAAAAAFVCACFCGVVFSHRPGANVPERQQSQAVAAKRTTRGVQPATVVSAVTQVRRKRRIEVKLAQFPAPTPLTNEERALLKMATTQPAQIPTELTELGAPIEPIEIAAIDIKPLK